MRRNFQRVDKSEGFILPFIMVILFLALIVVLSMYGTLQSTTSTVMLGSDKTHADVVAVEAVNHIESDILNRLKTYDDIEKFLAANGGECTALSGFDPNDIGFNCEPIPQKDINDVLEKISSHTDYQPRDVKIGSFTMLPKLNFDFGVVYYNIRAQERIARDRKAYLFVTTVITSHMGVPSILESGYIVYPHKVVTP